MRAKRHRLWAWYRRPARRLVGRARRALIFAFPIGPIGTSARKCVMRVSGAPRMVHRPWLLMARMRPQFYVLQRRPFVALRFPTPTWISNRRRWSSMPRSDVTFLSFPGYRRQSLVFVTPISVTRWTWMQAERQSVLETVT